MLHGAAGDSAAKEYTEYGVTASLIIEHIPLAFKRYANEHEKDSDFARIL
jgi:NAD(P)H-hydrate repair Nnr-like enzyme with NAD(P)H-hydrate dehydratase domain